MAIVHTVHRDCGAVPPCLFSARLMHHLAFTRAIAVHGAFGFKLLLVSSPEDQLKAAAHALKHQDDARGKAMEASARLRSPQRLSLVVTERIPHSPHGHFSIAPIELISRPMVEMMAATSACELAQRHHPQLGAARRAPAHRAVGMQRCRLRSTKAQEIQYSSSRQHAESVHPLAPRDHALGGVLRGGMRCSLCPTVAKCREAGG